MSKADDHEDGHQMGNSLKCANCLKSTIAEEFLQLVSGLLSEFCFAGSFRGKVSVQHKLQASANGHSSGKSPVLALHC